MSNEQQDQQQPDQEKVPVESTNAFRAGFMAGYTKDNPNADPSVAGYMDGYFVQRGGQLEEDDD